MALLELSHRTLLWLLDKMDVEQSRFFCPIERKKSLSPTYLLAAQVANFKRNTGEGPN